MCGFCLAENFKHNSEEKTILFAQYCSSSNTSDLYSEVPVMNLSHATAIMTEGFMAFLITARHIRLVP